MSDIRGNFEPNKTTHVGLRPLNRGMYRDVSGQSIPDPGFFTLENFITDKYGPKRTPGYTEWAGGDTMNYRPQDLVTTWSSSGTQVQLLITSGTLYQVGPLTELTEKTWTYTSGTVAADGTGVIGSGTGWASYEILAGDLFRIGSEESAISELTGTDSLTLASALSNVYASGTSYSIQRTFNEDLPDMVDWIVIDDKVIFADGRRPIREYDVTSGTMSWYITGNPDYGSGSEEFISYCLMYFLDRIWSGHEYTATDGDERHRITWSKVTNTQDFSDGNFVDRPYSAGKILRLIPMGNMAVCYYEDAIDIGTITNYPDLPLAWQRLETGGIGLVGMKAVCSWGGGHYFIGQDDIYYLDNSGIKGIGSPVVRETIHECDYLTRCYVAPDPQNFRICFGFPESSEEIAKIWSFNYQTEQWSYDNKQTYMIVNPVVDYQLSWDDLTGTWDTLPYASWDDMEANPQTRSLYIEFADHLWKLSKAGKIDPNDVAITGIMETKDYDFGDIDRNKTWSRISMKIYAPDGLDGDLEFVVQGSGDQGSSWKSLGTLSIPEGENEGKVNFKLTSSHARFKFTTGSNVRPYYVTEISMKVKGRGIEYRPQDTQ